MSSGYMKRFVKHVQTVVPSQFVECDWGRFVSDMIPVKEPLSLLAPSLAMHENACMLAVINKTTFNTQILAIPGSRKSTLGSVCTKDIGQ